MTLVLPATLERQIVGEAKTHYPRECCGLIEGVWQGTDAHGLALHPAPNLATADDRFQIDPATHLAAQRIARANGHGLIGCYHSHPNGVARPSEADAMGAADRNFIWLIAALDKAADAPVLKAFAYSGVDFAEIGMVTGADLVTSLS